MPDFAWPWMFLVLPLPWLVWRLVPAAQVRAALRLPQHGLNLEARSGLARRHWSPLWLLAWLLLVCAAARPQQLGPPIDQPRSGRAMMLAIDISGSMQNRDMQLGGRMVSRFVATRAIAGDFIHRRQGDELGLILFGSHAYLITPLTYDLTTVRKQLDGSAVGLAGRETSIGDAIGVAVKRLAPLPSQARVLILLTDGVNTSGNLAPTDAAKIAKAAGVRIYTIGIGGEGGGLQSIFGGMMQGPGARLDVRSLTELAESTGGHFYRATDTAELAAAWHSIDRLEPVKQKARPLRRHRDLFRWPLLAAVLLALLAAAMQTWPGRREQSA
ncbi:MAG: VWA domain-containing protein [Rhodanobacteraceae bacterium]